MQELIINFSRDWISLYVITGFALLIIEFCSITMKFCKKYFVQIMIFMMSISAVYFLYSGQDPAQVYQFYSDDYLWRNGIYYMNSTLSVQAYTVIVFGNVICGVLGFASFMKFTQRSLADNREEYAMKSKFDNVSYVASVFVHSIKNQLLANRVVHKRIQGMFENNEIDMDRLKDYIVTLSEQNETMLSRLDELYRSIRSNSILLVPVPVEEIIRCAVERFHNKFPEKQVDIVMEAGKVLVLTHNERLYTVIEVKDNGKGIGRENLKQIVNPFYSSKNSNYNWGMGLYYVRAIAKGHYGTLRYESKENEGSSFYILIPKYKE
ncbi:HAMP domain-containing sensor histidine kinase [Lachnospiraceae bacterium 54-53]